MKKKLDETLPKDLQDFSMAKADISQNSNNSNSSNESEESSSLSQAGTDLVDNSSSKEQEPHKKGEKSMADNNEKIDVRKEVEALLAEKDAQASVEKKIASLEAEKAELAQQLTEAKAANDTVSSELDTAKADLDSKTKECEALTQEKEESITKAAKAEKQLEEIRAEQTVASRTAALEEAKLLLAEGEKRDAQLDKVKVMSEEAFASYVEELCDIRGISVATETKDDDKTKTPAEDKAEAGSEDKKDEEKTEKSEASLPPADLGDGEKFQQSVAAASAQVTLEDDKVEAYASM